MGLVPVPLPPDVEDMGHRVIGCAITVHRLLGPGFKESIYQKAFCLELEEAGLRFECEKPIVVRYKRWELAGQRLDLLVGGCIVVELKALPRLTQLHRRQVVSYLRATELRLGYVINFDVDVLKDGIRRVVL